MEAILAVAVLVLSAVCAVHAALLPLLLWKLLKHERMLDTLDRTLAEALEPAEEEKPP